MRWVIAAAILCVLNGMVWAVRNNDAKLIEQAGGLVAICAALGAVALLSRSQEISESERRLSELPDLVNPERAHELVSALRRKDRLDQLTLIVLSAIGAALQAFAEAALVAGRAVVGVFLGH